MELGKEWMAVEESLDLSITSILLLREFENFHFFGKFFFWVEILHCFKIKKKVFTGPYDKPNATARANSRYLFFITFHNLWKCFLQNYVSVGMGFELWNFWLSSSILATLIVASSQQLILEP